MAPRDLVVCFRPPPDLLERLDNEAKRNDRSRSAQIVRLIREGLEGLEGLDRSTPSREAT